MMNSTISEKFYEKFAWIFFLIIGIFILVGAIPHAVGFNTDPALVQTISGKTIDELRSSSSGIFNLYNFYFRGGGLSDLGFAFFLIVISMTAYRLGQKWAWYAFWFVPTYFLSWIGLSLTLPSESSSSLILPLTVFIILSFVGLFLPFRKFFPSKKV